MYVYVITCIYYTGKTDSQDIVEVCLQCSTTNSHVRLKSKAENVCVKMPTGCQRRNEALERARGNDQHLEKSVHLEFKGAPKWFEMVLV